MSHPDLSGGPYHAKLVRSLPFLAILASAWVLREGIGARLGVGRALAQVT